MSTATAEGGDDAQQAAAALLARLQAQFGDMDVEGMLLASSASAAEAHGTTDGPGNGLDDDGTYESDESSVVEPTPEELAAWQAAQYQTAKWGRESLARNKAAADEAGADEAGGMTSEQLTEWIQVEGPPSLEGGQESAFLAPDDPILTSLAAEEAMLNGPWQRLYSSNTDGLSYAGLVSALRGYDGPTVLLVGAVPPPAASYAADARGGDGMAHNTATIGYYTATAWKESGMYYGDENCFLFTASGDDQSAEKGDGVQIFRPTNHKFTDDNNATRRPKTIRPINYQFCHSTIAAAIVSDGRKPGQHPGDANVGARGRAAVQVPPGLGVGESRGIGPRLHITESLEGCRALPYDDTFAAGPLLPPFFGDSPTHSFDVDVMEAWGVGGSQRIQRALAARKRDRSFKEASRKRNAEVDKAQFLDHFRSDMVHSKAFAHARHTSGRVDDCELESDGSMLSHLG